MHVTINDARALGKRLNVYGLLIVAIDDDGSVRVVSWGRTRRECDDMQPLGDEVMRMLVDGDLALRAFPLEPI